MGQNFRPLENEVMKMKTLKLILDAFLSQTQVLQLQKLFCGQRLILRATLYTATLHGQTKPGQKLISLICLVLVCSVFFPFTVRFFYWSYCCFCSPKIHANEDPLNRVLKNKSYAKQMMMQGQNNNIQLPQCQILEYPELSNMKRMIRWPLIRFVLNLELFE